MQTILTIHIIAVAIFLIFFLIKTVLLVLRNYTALENFRKRTKVPDMIASTVFLLTGIYMIAKIGFGTIGGWFHLKLTLVVLGMVLGIIAFKRKNALLAVLAALMFLYIYGISETKDAKMGMTKKALPEVVSDPNSPDYDILKHGRNVYAVNCASCHGEDGKQRLSGASDLSTSTISAEEAQTVILKGRNNMAAYENKLTPEEIAAVTSYVLSLRNTP
jgi:mono/diheme cytochrome c family protein